MDRLQIFDHKVKHRKEGLSNFMPEQDFSLKQIINIDCSRHLRYGREFPPHRENMLGSMYWHWQDVK